MKIYTCAGLLIDCFKTIEYFRFRFCPLNHCIFTFRLFFSKESKIACISDCLRHYSDKQEITSQCLLTTITHYTQVIINNLPPLKNNCCALSSLKNDQLLRRFYPSVVSSLVLYLASVAHCYKVSISLETIYSLVA